MVFCDVSGCIEKVSAGEVRRVRHQPGTYVKGRWQEGAETEIAIKASVQPVTGKELQMLPQTFMSRATIKVYSVDELFQGSREAGQSPDSIIWRDKRYEVNVVEDWSEQGGYYKAFALLEIPNQ